MTVKTQFFELADKLCGGLHADETLLCTLAAERSDFVRFNEGRVRQAGSVEQRYLSLRLVRAGRQASASIALTGREEDLQHATDALRRVREMLAQVPEDPWLLISTEPSSTTSERRGVLPPVEAVIEQITKPARPDFVGFYAGGTIYRAFANSLGQRNWHAIDTFNLEWSLHLRGDKAVKDAYAGFDWETEAFASRLNATTERLELLGLPPRTLEPGGYRAYLAPRALVEITNLLTWDGFSARARATKQSPLLRMELGEKLSPEVSLIENTQAGVAPRFQQDGFVKPDSVTLIDHGALGEALVSPRSAKEYGLRANGAGPRESPDALEMSPGTLPMANALAALDTGLYIGNLWYLNFSDRPAGRITGMTRFATFWVEGGRIVAPVNALRFDDSVYRMLGENLVALTRERDLLLDASTYDERSTVSARLPGALLKSLCFTL